MEEGGIQMKKGPVWVVVCMIVTIGLIACGGGGGSDSTPSAPVYSISGTVTGPWVEGVKITLSGAATANATTDANGNYSLTSLPSGTYTVTPALAGYTYSPNSAIVVIASADRTQDFTAASEIASYSISGTISYSGPQTGRVYINVTPMTCSDCSAYSGTSIASVGAFTIRGLPSGDYQLSAWMDNMGTGARNYSNPSGWFGPVSIASANATGVSVSLSDSAGGAVATTPTGLTVNPGNGSALILWNETTYNGVEAATSYKIYWGTDTNASNGGTITAGARDDTHYFQSVANGIYYYKISSLFGTTESAVSAVVGPITIGALAGANTISGTVTFPGAATGPLYVGLYSSSTKSYYFTRIAGPTSPQPYSIAGVPSGDYQVFADIDMNNNGVVNDGGDISNMNGPLLTVAISGNTMVNQTLSGINSAARVMTVHQVSGANHSYGLEMEVDRERRRPVAVTLVSGPNVAVPADAGQNSWGFDLSSSNTATPSAGDAYVFKVIYSDGTSEMVTGAVTAVLDSFAQNLAPTSSGSGVTTPTFTWNGPASPPAYYAYSITLNGNDATWFYPQGDRMPSTQNSVLYNIDGRASKTSLTPGVTYNWAIIVEDGFRNKATQWVTYTP